jgi:hypothetical protein
MGKVETAVDFGLINEKYKPFIRYFSELRNQLVHNVENIEFSFDLYVKHLSENEIKSVRGSILAGYHHGPDNVTQNVKEMWQEPGNLRKILWLAALSLAIKCNSLSANTRFKKMVNKVSAETAETLFEKNRSHFERPTSKPLEPLP